MTEIEKPKILVVDDKPENLLSMEILLGKEPYDIVKASSGNEALSCVIREDFAVVLLDVQMPEMDGFETAELMRTTKQTSLLPIIFITAINKEEKHVFKGYRSGAVDYIFKPVDKEIILSKVRVFADLFRQKKIIEDQNFQLDAANRTIQKQQRAVIEEERLKVVLQMAGATAHELNQPLMALLGNIELMRLTKYDPEKIKSQIDVIEKAGRRISNTVKRIQTIQHEKTKAYPGGENIIDIHQKENILCVEDDDRSFKVFKKMTGKKRTADIHRAINIKEAKQLLSNNNYELAMLDLRLPDGDAFELLTFMKKQKMKICVVVLTGFGAEDIAVRCLREGAHGYLSKGDISTDILNQTIDEALEKFRFDVEKGKAIVKMAEMSTIDELTGLYNRRYMTEMINQEFNRSRRYDSDLSCLILDLDYFKRINDTYGHVCGDFVLKKFSKILTQNARNLDHIFRYGGEEFLILLSQTSIDGAWTFAEKKRIACENEAYSYKGQGFRISVSIGLASIKNNVPDNAESLISFADKALYQAKADGRNCVKIFQA